MSLLDCNQTGTHSRWNGQWIVVEQSTSTVIGVGSSREYAWMNASENLMHAIDRMKEIADVGGGRFWEAAAADKP